MVKAEAEAAPQSVVHSKKKGFAIKDDQVSVPALNIAWFYNWGITTTRLYKSIQFVSMTWGIHFNTHQVGGDTILGFNEPDMVNQGNMTPSTAIKLWAVLERTGKRLVSPATTINIINPKGWLAQFMALA